MCDRFLVWLAAVTAALALAGTLQATEFKPLVLPLTVNEVPRGDVLIGLGDGDVLMRIHDLEQLGLSGDMWRRVLIAGRLRTVAPGLQGGDAVVLSSLSPWVKFAVDEVNLSMTLTADPLLFAPTVESIQNSRPRNLLYGRDKTAFVNYAFTSGVGSDVGGLSAFAETGISVAGNLLYTSLGRTSEGDVQRSLTNYTVDDPARLRRWIFGDATAGFDSLSGSPFVGGVTFRRSFNLDPYFIRYPAMNIRGAALTPSRVSVYVNGTLVSQQQIGPGPFELQNLPVTGGAGATQIVIRDAFGNERVEGGSFYYSTEVLARGLSDFNYSAGLLREDLASKSFSYGDPVVFASHRYGLTDSLTVGGRLEGTRDLWSGGPVATVRSRFGEVDLSLAGSSAKGRTGNAQLLNYRYLARRFSLGFGTRRMTDEYSNVSLDARADRATFDGTLFGSVIFRRGSITGQLSRTTFRDSADNRRATVQTTLLVTPRISAFVTAGVSEIAGRREGEYSFGISLYAGHNTTVNTTAERRGDRSTIFLDAQRSLPVGTGYGYRLQTRSTEGVDAGNASVQYQTSFGRYELGFDPYDISGTRSLSASGGIVYQQRHVVFTRAVQDAFGLVRVAGVPNVRVYLSNQLVGKTDARGDLLVPNLLSYYGNEIRIEDDDIPLNYQVEQISRTVAPPYRGGALLEFPIRRMQTILGRVAVRTPTGELVPPSYGQVTISGVADAVSPLSKAGDFYLENLATGSYAALVEWSDGTCTFNLVVPVTTEPVIKLGTVICSPDQERKP